MIILAKTVQHIVPIREHTFLSPRLHCLNSFTLVGIGWGLLFLLGCLGVFLRPFLIFLLHFFLGFDSKNKFLVCKVEESAGDWFPLLSDVSLAIGVDGDAFLFHKEKSLSVEVYLFLHIVYIGKDLPPATLMKSSKR